MPKIDKEMEQFEKDLLQSIGEMKRGEVAAVHTPGQIAARKRGRPAGSIKAEPKVSTTIRFDQDVLDALKATGTGWQTRANDALRGVFVTKAEAIHSARKLAGTGARKGEAQTLGDFEIPAWVRSKPRA